MYTCSECSSPIRGVSGDPVHHLSKRGVICTGCLRKPEPAPEGAAPTAARGAAAKARWDAMSPEERTARVAKMQAARATPRTKVV